MRLPASPHLCFHLFVYLSNTLSMLFVRLSDRNAELNHVIPPKEMRWVQEFLWLAESCIGTLNLRRPPPPGFLEKVGLELGINKSVGFGQALGTGPGH